MIEQIDSSDASQSRTYRPVNLPPKPPPAPVATATPSGTPAPTTPPASSDVPSAQPPDNVLLRYSVAAIGAFPAIKTTRSLVTTFTNAIGASLRLRGDNGALRADASRATAALQRNAANGLDAFSHDFTTAAKGVGTGNVQSLLRDATSQDSSFRPTLDYLIAASRARTTARSYAESRTFFLQIPFPKRKTLRIV